MNYQNNQAKTSTIKMVYKKLCKIRMVGKHIKIFKLQYLYGNKIAQSKINIGKKKQMKYKMIQKNKKHLIIKYESLNMAMKQLQNFNNENKSLKKNLMNKSNLRNERPKKVNLGNILNERERQIV